jgi:hypothetical protein
MTPQENPFIPLTFRAYSGKAQTYPLALDPLCSLLSKVAVFEALVTRERTEGPYAGRKQEDHKREIKRALGEILRSLNASTLAQETTLEECGLINLVKLRDEATA